VTSISMMLVGARRSILACSLLAVSLSACPAGNRADPPRPALPSQPRADRGLAGAITAPCVLHAGDSHHNRREIRNANGEPGGVVESASCSFNAECVEEVGKVSAGDGDVGIDCTDRRCTCRQTILSSPTTPTTFTFESDAPCSTTEEARRLLVENCMKGMKVEQRTAR
jgi:hypothetical protein